MVSTFDQSPFSEPFKRLLEEYKRLRKELDSSPEGSPQWAKIYNLLNRLEENLRLRIWNEIIEPWYTKRFPDIFKILPDFEDLYALTLDRSFGIMPFPSRWGTKKFFWEFEQYIDHRTGNPIPIEVCLLGCVNHHWRLWPEALKTWKSRSYSIDNPLSNDDADTFKDLLSGPTKYFPKTLEELEQEEQEDCVTRQYIAEFSGYRKTLIMLLEESNDERLDVYFETKRRSYKDALTIRRIALVLGKNHELWRTPRSYKYGDPKRQNCDAAELIKVTKLLSALDMSNTNVPKGFKAWLYDTCFPLLKGIVADWNEKGKFDHD